MEAKSGPDTERQRLVRLIHVGKRDLRMSEDIYRLLLKVATGKTSTTDMTVPELEKALEAMKAKGFKVRHKTRPHPNPSPKGRGATSRPVDQSAMVSKLRALWLDLHALGVVRDPNESALASWASNSRSPNVTAALQLLDYDQLDRAIERAKQWRARYLMGGDLYCPACGDRTVMSLRLTRQYPGVRCGVCDTNPELVWRRKLGGAQAA